MARPSIHPIISRVGVKRASTSSFRPPTGMANSKATRTISRLTYQKEPAPGDEHRQHGVDHPSEQLQSEDRQRTRQCRLPFLHFLSHKPSTLLTRYRRRPLDLLRMSTFHRQGSPGPQLLSSSQKNGRATSKSRAGSFQVRKRPRHVVRPKLQSDPKELAKPLLLKTSDRKRKAYLRSHDQRSTKPRPTTLQLAMLMRWTLIRAHRLCRTLFQV
jgi:hypothetical protein